MGAIESESGRDLPELADAPHGLDGSTPAGSVEALDMERLARAMSVSLDMYGWDLDSMARDIAAAYDAEE